MTLQTWRSAALVFSLSAGAWAQTDAQAPVPRLRAADAQAPGSGEVPPRSEVPPAQEQAPQEAPLQHQPPIAPSPLDAAPHVDKQPDEAPRAREEVPTGPPSATIEYYETVPLEDEAPLPGRRGFFGRARPMFGPLFLSSKADISDFLASGDSSTATAWGGGLLLNAGFGVGGSLAISGMLEVFDFSGLRVRRDALSVQMKGVHLQGISLGPSVTYFPFEGSGLSAELLLAISMVTTGEESSTYLTLGEPRMEFSGFMGGLSLGYEWQLTKKAWAGLGSSFHLSRLSTLDGVSVVALRPSISASITLF